MINKKTLRFYRVDNFKDQQPFLVPSTLTLIQLMSKINQTKLYKDFEIFMQSEILEVAQKSLTMEEIIKRKYIGNDQPPTFYICEFDTNQEHQTPQQNEYYESIKELLKLQMPTKTQWRGANGHLLFEGRNNSLIASSFKQSANLHKQKNLNMNKILSTESDSQLTSETKEIKSLISYLKKKQSKQDFNQTSELQVSKKYTNYDINFITTLQKTYLTYMLRSGGKLAYIEYTRWDFGVIQRKLKKDDKIGIIGDYGTGLADSYQLLQNMVIRCGVNVILHLGDVYYAGTPQQYENNVGSFIRRLRVKSKKQILFYSIPGNHDYYSWGMPFLCFVKEINSQEFTKQRASYFCLRTEDDQWQFLGADTAYHDSSPYDQINQINVGPRLRNKELAWHKQKLQNFKGSTIFLTHHQLFSIHDRLCGSLSKYRCFSCINPLLSKQLFEYLPYFSAWFWGHQHAFMLFKQNFWGVPLCRLLGNSSFHVIYEKQHPYQRKPSFPKIPFITDDQQYCKKYLPLSPKKSKQIYFNLCFGVIDLKQSMQNILIEYFCSPSYNEATIKQQYFQYYKLYEQIIQGKQSIIKQAKNLSSAQKWYLKNEIGLILTVNNDRVQLSLKGTLFRICPLKQNNNLLIQEEIPVYIQTDKQNYTLFLSYINNNLKLAVKPSSKSIWTLKKRHVMQDNSKVISTLNTFLIRCEQEIKYLGLIQSKGLQTPTITLSESQVYWMLIKQQNVVQ